MSKQHLVPKPLRYHLRFQIIPSRHVERDARDLARFCKRHGVEEVVLIFAGEEWNNGLLSKREEDLWFNTVRQAKQVLERAGIAVSLNPWMTTLHLARGRRFPHDRRFKPMVSPLGEVSKACASFADPAWQAYYYKLMRRFAELGFRVIWVEDDFRYHNHGPLTWGGGFEPIMRARFAAKLGRRSVSREEVVRNILKSGRPHPWRSLWMETWREVHLEVARGIAQAVRAKRPGRTKVGLMSSHPAVHSTEGRRWQAMFEALSIDGRVAHRPNFAGYTETVGTQKVHSMMMLDLQKTLRPAGCEVAPEIENAPYSRWTKSDALTWADMALCLFHGSDALLLNLFPFAGNRASQQPQVGELLDKSRPALEWIAARFPNTLTTRGVGLPWKQDAQEHVRTTTGSSLEEFDANCLGPGYLLIPYGIPAAPTPQAVNALFGSLAWAVSDDEVLALLRGGLLLDGTSADILCRRGFSRQIGLMVEGLAEREKDVYSVETLSAPLAGVPAGFLLNINLHGRLARLRPLGGAEEWTTVITPTGKRFGAGLVAHRNALGGRVVTYAAPDPATLPRCYQRQRIALKVVDFLAGRRFPFATVQGSPHCLPMYFQEGNRHCVVILNGSPDPAVPVVRVAAAARRPTDAVLLAPLAKPRKAQVQSRVGKPGCVVRCQTEIPYLGYLVLEWN